MADLVVARWRVLPVTWKQVTSSPDLFCAALAQMLEPGGLLRAAVR